MLDAHAAMPLVELFEQVRVDLEQIERGRIGQRGRFHEAQEQEQIVELGRLLAQLVFVAPQGGAAQEVSESTAEQRQLVRPRPTVPGLLHRRA